MWPLFYYHLQRFHKFYLIFKHGAPACLLLYPQRQPQQVYTIRHHFWSLQITREAEYHEGAVLAVYVLPWQLREQHHTGTMWHSVPLEVASGEGLLSYNKSQFFTCHLPLS